MGREVKRVPLDFDWPLGKRWYGYIIKAGSLCLVGSCIPCRKFAKSKGLSVAEYGCPDFEPLLGPPTGDGFQLWETTTDGSPMSPVFAVLDDLCVWCAGNLSFAGKERGTLEEWREALEKWTTTWV